MSVTTTILKRKDGLQLDPSMKQAVISLNGVADETLTVLVANAVATEQIQVYGISFSSDVASGFILQSNANIILPLNMSNIGGIINMSSNGDEPLFACNLGESLKLLNKASLAAAANAGILILYKIRIQSS